MRRGAPGRRIERDSRGKTSRSETGDERQGGRGRKRQGLEDGRMNELVALTIRGHGGIERWEEISHFKAAGSISGAILTMKGKGGQLDDVIIEGEARDQRLKITPFLGPGKYATWQPQTQTIESVDGRIVLERPEPRAAFAEQTCESTWDDFQVACFASEATWNYFVAPFVMARPD